MLLAERRQWLQLLSRQVVAQLRPSTQDKQHDPSKKHLHGYRKTHSPKSLRDSEPIFWQQDFDTQEYSSRAILSCSRVALNGPRPDINEWKRL